jgi:hypothetical protein
MDVKLAFAQDSLPLSIICAGVSLTIDPSLASGAVLTLHLSSG